MADISTINHVVMSSTNYSSEPLMKLHILYGKNEHFIPPFIEMPFEKTVAYHVIIDGTITNFMTIIYPLFYKRLVKLIAEVCIILFIYVYSLLLCFFIY